MKKLAVAALPKLALPDEIFPVTPKLVNVPTLVMFGCAAVVTVPAVVAALTVPVTLAPASCDRPLPLPVNTPVFDVMFAAVTVPLTPKLVNVPTDVMLGCAAVVTVPAVVALVAAPLNAPTKVVAVIELLDKLAMRPVLVTSAIFPVAAFAKIMKLFPVPAATLILSATFA